MPKLKYTVKYRTPGSWRWRKLTAVTGDGIDIKYGFRFFYLDDGRQVCIPMYSEVEFSSERQLVIAANMSKEAGQPVQIND
jgi:hypothetical protein